jgi:hypothetical protein
MTDSANSSQLSPKDLIEQARGIIMNRLYPDDLDAVVDAFDAAADALRTATALKPVAVATNSP